MDHDTGSRIDEGEPGLAGTPISSPGSAGDVPGAAEEVRRTSPQRGVEATGRPTSVPNISRTQNGDSALPADERRRCGGVQKNGEPCHIVMTVDTPDGPRCRYHRSASTGGTRLRAPVRSLRSMEDAARLMSWASVAVAEGRLSQSAALAIKATVSEWRQSFDAADADRQG